LTSLRQRAPVTEPAASNVININFHGIGEPPTWISDSERTVWMPIPGFGAVLDCIADQPDIRLTFDDGNASDVEVALPMLVERGLRATFFVVADRIDRLGYLSATDLKELAGHGMGIGSHGLSHRSWRGLDDRALAHELASSRSLIEHAAGVAVYSAACPFGSYDRRVLRGLRAGGYARVFTSDGGAARAGSWLQPRTSLRRWDDEAAIERIRSSGALQRATERAKRVAKAWR
jgi:peptidoglycan/xylan/chitin deacetylase (PgdA/CDA1 family)